MGHDQGVMNVNSIPPESAASARLPQAGPAATTSPATASGEPRDWTVLLYLDGNNDIEGDVLNAFLTAEQVSRIDRTAVVAQLARAPQSMAHASFVDNVDGDWAGVRRYAMDPGPPAGPYDPQHWTSNGTHNGRIDSPLVQDLGPKTDMSRKATLQDFLEWGIKTYPARHYMVVVADHGMGYLGTLTDQVARREMRLPELHETLQAVRESTGVKPDILVMDACLMAAAEAACEVRDDAGLYVASEDINYDCYPFQATFEALARGEQAGREVTPREIGEAILDAAATRPRTYPYVSMIDLGKMGSLVDCMTRFAARLLATATPREIIREDFASACHFSKDAPNVKPYEDYRDLLQLADAVAHDDRIRDEDLKWAASDAARALRSDVLLSKRQPKDGGKDVGGLSIYVPPTGFVQPRGVQYPTGTFPKDLEPVYRDLQFAKITGWDRVIEQFAVPAK